MIPVKKMELMVIAPLPRKEATVIPLQVPASETTQKMKYIMPPQPQGYFKGRDNDCL